MYTQLQADSSCQNLEPIKSADPAEKAWPIKVFRNIIFKYFKDTDNLSVYLVDCNSSVEDHCIDVTVNFLISYDINEKIVAFHVGGVSQLLSCNTFDLDEAFNEDPPKPVYFEDSDILIVTYENGISLVKSAVVGIKESGNFEDLLKEALSNELFLEDKLVKVDLQCNDSSAWHPILNGLTENLEACFQLKAQHVRFTISHSILIPDELSNEGSSAFNFMMTQQRLKKLPPLYNSQFRNDLLYNDFLKILQERKLGWLNDNHLTIGHSFIRRVTDLVWYLDPHLGKLEKRGLKLPKIIAKLSVYASESHYNLYHDTTKHKKIEISREKLESFVKALILSIQQPWTRLLHWEEVIKDIDDLIKIAQEYANYIQGVNNRMRTIHTSLVPVRNGRDDITVEDIEAVDLYPSQYEFLAQLLRESNDYDLLNIDHLLPPKPQNIYLFFQNICAD
ncbi:hypothetical protein GLOIN_2v1886194, partial [Rhizophagus irregularis DAOM 181602=DAOM 197198]